MGLVDAFGELTPWTAAPALSPAQRDRYVAVAAAVQRHEPAAVERAIGDFLSRRSGPGNSEDETRIFLLLRVVFELPEHVPADERASFKGWVNWPAPAPDGTVSLAWPIAWAADGPVVVAPYEGFEGPEYAAVEEYRHLLERHPLRALPDSAA